MLGRKYYLEYTTDFLTWTPYTTVRTGDGTAMTIPANFLGFPKFFVRPRVGP